MNWSIRATLGDAVGGVKRRRARRRRLTALVRVVVAGGALAASVPHDLAGQASPNAFDPTLLQSGDIIRYRELTRGDFLARRPPEASGAPHGEVGAVTCVSLATTPETSIRTTFVGLDERRGVVRAQVEHLEFIAFMNRTCSWWNPGSLTLPADYILQHEQIHFALFEIAARRLNARVPALTQVEAISDNRQQAVDDIRRQIDEQMQRELDEVLVQSTDFDLETSRTYRQDRQYWWWQTVARELDRLTPARGAVRASVP